MLVLGHEPHVQARAVAAEGALHVGRRFLLGVGRRRAPPRYHPVQLHQSQDAFHDTATPLAAPPPTGRPVM